MSENAARDRQYSLTEALEGKDENETQREMQQLLQQSSSDADAPADDEEAKLAQSIERQQQATTKLASLHSQEAAWLQKLKSGFDRLMGQLDKAQVRVLLTRRSYEEERGVLERLPTPTRPLPPPPNHDINTAHHPTTHRPIDSIPLCSFFFPLPVLRRPATTRVAEGARRVAG